MYEYSPFSVSFFSFLFPLLQTKLIKLIPMYKQNKCSFRYIALKTIIFKCIKNIAKTMRRRVSPINTKYHKNWLDIEERRTLPYMRVTA